MDLSAIPDEVLVDIFLRLPTLADLIRVSAACVSFRRLVADRSFRRLFRKLHSSPLLGFLDKHSFHPVIPPHPSAPAANAVALAVDFSFLPSPAGDWSVRDVRDGRVLLDRPRRHYTRVELFVEIVVCDPLYRLFILLPPIPDDLTTTVERPRRRTCNRFCETFLIPPAGDEAEETSFRVMWVVHCEAKLVAFVFSSNTGHWQAVPSRSWTSLFAGLVSVGRGSLFHIRQQAYGCIYWMLKSDVEKKMLVFDTQRMEFSTAEPPIEARDASFCHITMAETREGRPGMFVLKICSSESELSYSIRQHDGGSSSQWKKKIISLGSWYVLIGSVERYLFLYHQLRGYFTLDIKTFQLEKLCDGKPGIAWRHAYSNFPPSLLSSPRISSGVGNGAETLEQGCAASSSA